MPRHPIELAREAKLAKRRKGIVAYNQQARENYGVSLPALVRKPDEHRAAMLRVGCRRMHSVVIANAATGKLVPHQQMREAVRTNRAPHPRPNPQARPVTAARKFLSKTAVPVPRASAVYGQRRMAAGRVVVTIADAGAKLPREREYAAVPALVSRPPGRRSLLPIHTQGPLCRVRRAAAEKGGGLRLLGASTRG